MSASEHHPFDSGVALSGYLHAVIKPGQHVQIAPITGYSITGVVQSIRPDWLVLEPHNEVEGPVHVRIEHIVSIKTIPEVGF